MVKITDDKTIFPSDSKYNSYFESYSYPLSNFQKHAIQSIVDGNHALVCAPTGSGKTLPAEFAIRHFTGLGKRVIYCSPIKALSNQKLFDFTNKYPDITFGLLTGDIKTNPTAQVLIMTTEILMNRLFTLSKQDEPASSLSFDMDIQNELGAVVFDELHYINDQHRGHVWEQSILMLPSHIQMVMLSATLDDPVKFASWCETNGSVDKEVIICSTDHRVVPLTHYMFLSSSEGLFKKVKDKDLEQRVRSSLNKCLTIKTADGKFNDDTYYESGNILKLMSEHNLNSRRKFVLNELFTHLKATEMLPAIVFIFSRKLVEQCAEEITVPLYDSDVEDYNPFLVKNECDAILRRLPNWREYAELSEYKKIVSLLEKGIGIHHSGMIPVLREIVEIMISKKYIKVLFATESFAIGLDCPIKTAVFISLKKFDGSQQRYLLPHEYTQMAGRAGRRGLDTIGNVIHCVNLFEQIPINIYKEVLCGKPQKLVSKFQIYYPTILNVLKNTGTASINDIETFIQQSMMKSELEIVKGGICKEIVEIEEKIVKKEDGFQYLKTKKEILADYYGILERIEYAANKNRKLLEASIRKMKGEYVNLEKDFVYYSDYMKLKDTKNIKEGFLLGNQLFIQSKIEALLNIMEETGVVIQPKIGIYNLTEERGTVASRTAEINPILISLLCSRWDYFISFTASQLAAFFSLFTDVRVAEEIRVNEGCAEMCYDTFLNNRIHEFEATRRSLMLKEQRHQIYFAGSIDGFCYDIVDDVLEWCECTDENACRELIMRLSVEKGISIGDFSKAVMKISTISREMTGMCEVMNKTGFMHKLSAIDGLVLKYVATSQSLYL
jgi:superfamily II RNA helicase